MILDTGIPTNGGNLSAAALTGSTLAAGVTKSSLTQVGILAAPHMTAPVIDSGGLVVTAGFLRMGAAPNATHAIDLDGDTYAGKLLSVASPSHGTTVTLGMRVDGNGMTFTNALNDFDLSVFRNQQFVAGSTYGNGSFEFEGVNSAGASQAYGLYACTVIDNTAGNESSELTFQVRNAGSPAYPVLLKAGRGRFLAPYSSDPNANWESIDIRWDSTIPSIQSNASGTGTLRNLQMGAGGRDFEFTPATGGARFRSTTDGAADLGDATHRFGIAFLNTRLVLGNDTSESGWIHIRDNTTGNMFHVDSSLNLTWSGIANPTVNGQQIGAIAKFTGSLEVNTSNANSTVALTLNAGNLGAQLRFINIPASGKLNWMIGEQAPTDNALCFTPSTAADGTTFTNPSLTLSAPGSVIVGFGALTTAATAGFLYIPSCPGIPSGTPNGWTGRVPMVYDSNNKKFWIYDTATLTWKGVVLA